MQGVGNVITVIGIAVTLVAYFGQHGLTRVRELEPGLFAWWNRRRVWVMVHLGRSKSVNIQGATAVATLNMTASLTGMVWSPLQPDDDLATRVDKMERNLDSLRSNGDELRQQDQQRFRDVTDGLSDRLAGLAAQVTAWRDESRQETTWAMRWEVRGLFIALVGAGISLLG